MAIPAATAFPAPGHDHGRCRTAAIGRARDAFERRGLKLTELRALIFGEIAASHQAIGAYDIIDRLARQGTRVAPVSVYRSLDVLLDAGVVHRLESRNAYFACHASDHAGLSHVVLACEGCGSVAEVSAHRAFEAIDAAARGVGFVAKSRLVEVTGRCAHCASIGSGEADAP